MPRLAALKKCSCSDHHPVNGQRRDGTPVALWTCPQHGNAFKEAPLGIVLTSIQSNVLWTISEERKAGRDAGIDEVSKILNYSTWSVRRAFAVLQSINFIEPS